MIKDLKNLQEEYPYLKEVDSCRLRCSIFNLDDAYQRFYKKQGELPKFKGKYSSKKSYRTNCISSTYKDKTYQSIEVDLKRHIIKLPKLKEGSIKGYRDLEYLPGRIINVTVEQASTGKYYVSVLVEENDIIVMESLKLKDMIEEKKLSKQLTNVSLGEFCRVLEYKAKIYGKRYIKIDSYYSSSQECSRCGYKNEQVKDLSVRRWVCPECGSYHDRDYNASYNIMFEGLKKYMMELK